jgi:hypothetical protein
LEFWDGRTVPAFDRLQDMEELHAKRGSMYAVHNSKTVVHLHLVSTPVACQCYKDWVESVLIARHTNHHVGLSGVLLRP